MTFELETVLKVAASLVVVTTFIITILRSYRKSAVQDSIRETEQNLQIKEIEISLNSEIDRVKGIEGKLEVLRDSIHGNDLKLSELKAIQSTMREAQLNIESDIKELISLVGRG